MHIAQSLLWDLDSAPLIRPKGPGPYKLTQDGKCRARLQLAIAVRGARGSPAVRIPPEDSQLIGSCHGSRDWPNPCRLHHTHTRKHKLSLGNAIYKKKRTGT